MGIIDGMFGWLRKPAPAAKGVAKAARAAMAGPGPSGQSQFHNSQSSLAAPNSTHAIRKDLLRMVLKETLSRNGIPATWIGADMLRSTSKGREPGIHVRLLMYHWDPRLLLHAVAFEQNFFKRVVAMDPLAAHWLMGISWQYAMEDVSQCPALPHPGSWTAMPSAGVASATGNSLQSAGDVIAGPVTIERSQDNVKADLERLLAVRDADMKKHGAEDFAATQPIQLDQLGR